MGKKDEFDFDNWEVATPSKEVEKKQFTDGKIIDLNIRDEYKVLSPVQEDDDDVNFIFGLNMFDKLENLSEEQIADLTIRFKLYEEYSNGVKLYEKMNDEDTYLIVKDNIKYIVYCYETANLYEDDEKLTFCGWDYNVIVNLKKMTVKEKNIR
jgi:hypothetical protein